MDTKTELGAEEGWKGGNVLSQIPRSERPVDATDHDQLP